MGSRLRPRPRAGPISKVPWAKPIKCSVTVTTIKCSVTVTPMTYVAAGRQFVVIAAGGHARLDTKFGDAVVAFAFPAGGAGN